MLRLCPLDPNVCDLNGKIMTIQRLMFLCLCCALCASCGSSVESVEEDPAGGPIEVPEWAEALPVGKADGVGGVIADKGALGIGEDVWATGSFAGTQRIHMYNIELAQGAQVALEVTQKGSSRGLDTGLFVFEPAPAGATGDLVASDSDSGWGTLSRLDSFTAPKDGVYTVWVMKQAARSRANYRVQATCLNGACAPGPQLAATCAFGSSFLSLRQGMELTRPQGSARVSVLPSAQDTLREQVIAAVATTYDDVRTYDEAMAAVDASEVHRWALWDTSSRAPFVAYQFWAGDNEYGAIFAQDGVEPLALIQDGEITACTQEAGAEQRACAEHSECGTNGVCFGKHEGLGRCLDRSARAPQGYGEACTDREACGSAGLECGGETVNAGYCVESWMRGSFGSLESSVSEIPTDGSALTWQVHVSGLATVSTDVRVRMHIDHADASMLRVTLTNPLGTQAVLVDGDAQAADLLRDMVVRAFPGDEDANGAWTFSVEGASPSRAGYIHSAVLDITSRMD